MSGPSASPYTPPTEGSYNASPPPDDGSETDANKIKWATIKTKLSDVVRAFALSMNTQIQTFAGKTVNTDAGVANVLSGNLAFEPSTLTISAGVIVPSRSQHLIDTEAAASTDDLVTITNTNMAADAIMLLRAADATHDIVLKHGTGNIFLSGSRDATLSDDVSLVALQRRSTNWFEIFRSGAGALDVQSFLTSGTWTKPAAGTIAMIEVWGAGGSGGRSDTTSDAGGGGGGAYSRYLVSLASLAATVSVTLGAGGPSKATAGNGTAGGNTTFGSIITGYGGGAGGGNVSSGAGGGGAGQFAAGASASGATAGAGGGGAPSGVTATGFVGGAAGSSSAGGSSYFGGGGGATTGFAGGASIYGGGGGGSDGGGSAGVGGASVMGGGGGGNGSDLGSAAGGVSVFAGSGGHGGQASAGVAGVQPSGGGGGANAGASGAGADGACRVTVF